MDETRRRFAIILSAITLTAGVGGLLAAVAEPFANPEGSLLGKLLHLNSLGALVTIGLAAVAFTGALARRRDLMAVAGAGFALAAVLTIVQTGGDPNWLGGRGNTLSMFLACTVGLLSLVFVPGARADAGTGRSPR